MVVSSRIFARSFIPAFPLLLSQRSTGITLGSPADTDGLEAQGLTTMLSGFLGAGDGRTFRGFLSDAILGSRQERQGLEDL
mmetsp:Transcript_151518/g.264038  ORF Transcript_151518/g.264038 Transcript_151518/m.264038 type:complete len:81 (-) Transcript_151518:84-326(-)